LVKALKTTFFPFEDKPPKIVKKNADTTPNEPQTK